MPPAQRCLMRDLKECSCHSAGMGYLRLLSPRPGPEAMSHLKLRPLPNIGLGELKLCLMPRGA